MKTLIIVSNQLQIINAREYIHSCINSNDDYDIILNSISRNEKGHKLLLETYANLNFSKEPLTMFHSNLNGLFNFHNKLKFYYDLKKLTSKLENKKYDKVVIGEIWNGIQLAIANKISDNQVFLDEGNSSYRIFEKLKGKPVSLAKSSVKTFLKAVRLSSNLKYDKQGRVSFFTLFHDKKTSKYKHLILQKNNLEYLKQRFENSKLNNNKVVFIGFNALEIFKDMNDYRHMLKTMSKDLSGKDVLYFPHRHERGVTAKDIENLGWTYMKTELPMELSLLSLDELPKQYYMFFSSVYDSVSNLQPSARFTSYFIPLEFYNRETKVYEIIYKSYEENSNIEVKYI
ncbi:MAG: hypothetical protein HRT66_12785 [Flavobacteriaceae bacterium]|nr:hypothetical protein [Flavobacteriaceae bacterium]